MESFEIANEIETHSFALSHVSTSASNEWDIDGDTDLNIRMFNKQQSSSKYLYRQIVGSRDHKLRAFLPTEKTALKLEFCCGLNDTSYFYLIGMIRLTERELIQLCRHLE